MKENGRGVSSQQLKNFMVKNTSDDSEALDCTISHLFIYSKCNISDSMVVKWPTVTGQVVTHTEGE